ncbi:SGNH/GDSL hydrolase family protein [Gilvimarinus algae]|uniref:SGNH/GDSL hydrolase family protein n=1 Tax=Gilvimarinus algae TaxID=3058037 RepID=A0ABT8TK45_9GAMM|nr:SGNH/GDSL hydrolase family protein [Gilvimarinus sp. SDUM040014]MDO3383965.1 SGNH/GDSL hydrolase family protein [Gilvimarinus sp. SDUM040014]
MRKRTRPSHLLPSLFAALLSLVACSGGGQSTAPIADNPASRASSSASSVSSVGASSLPSLNFIAPDDPAIRYTGRVAVTPEAASYDWANTQIEFRTNAAAVTLLLDDGLNDYNVFVGGELHSKVSTASGQGDYPLSLGEGEHRVLLTKRTGPNFGAGRFLGLQLSSDGELLPLPPAPERKLEFIGDSYTVGYGNEGPGLDCGGVLRPYENSYLSYAPIAARALGAQSHSIAISGFGAVRNYGDEDSTSATPMPFYYGRTLMARDDLPWGFSAWRPDAVVIKLGTNDHSTPPMPEASVFIQAVQDLIGQVTSAYGELPIVLLADSSLPQVVERLQAAAHEQAQMGNPHVHFVQVSHPPQSQLGCDWHPLVAGHQAMANQLAEALRPIMQW